MRHRNAGFKLGRNTSHRRALLRNLVTSVIEEDRVETTVAKAKAVRPHVEKMITLGKTGTLHARRLAASRLHQDEEAVKTLFTVIAPTQKERRGGYTRIVHLGSPSWKYRAFRQGDAAEMVILEFVDAPLPEAAAAPAAAEAEKPAEKTEGKAESKAEEKKEAPAPA